MLEEIKAAMDTKVRPILREHGGDAELLSFEDGIVRLRMVGQCASCPAASLTNETLIQEELRAAVPAVSQVVLVQEISEDLLAEAKRLMSHVSDAEGR